MAKVIGLRCRECGAEYELQATHVCETCFGPLDAVYDAALLNGENLMFCEDAARRIQAALDADEHITDCRIRATHQESLHPHDAVAMTVKGVAGGYAP